LRRLGIVRAWPVAADAAEAWNIRLGGAKQLDVVTLAGRTWTDVNSSVLMRLLLERGCAMRILLADPGSEFVKYRDQMQRGGTGLLPEEINQTITVLTQWMNQPHPRPGSLEVRFCKADLPCRIEVVDDTFIFWTPHLPPKRSKDVPAFEVVSRPNEGIGHMLKDYFETLWEFSANDVAVPRTVPGQAQPPAPPGP
jgi:hypothetical protein